jgi:DNA-binding NtrC family response regulator
MELDADALRIWCNYCFPGNVRELRNIVIRLCTKYAGMTVTPDMLKAELDQKSAAADDSFPPATDERALVEAARRQLESNPDFQLDDMLRRWERGFVEAALELTNGNLSQAAKRLGVHRTTLYSRMQSQGDAGEEK